DRRGLAGACAQAPGQGVHGQIWLSRRLALALERVYAGQWMRFARDGALLVLLAVGALLSLAGSALAATPLQPCGKHLTCGHVIVPLDPSGQLPGQVSHFVERYAQTANPTGGTVIALAGGPGQSAVDLLPGFADDLGPILANRALVVFDPRGVGRSGNL